MEKHVERTWTGLGIASLIIGIAGFVIFLATPKLPESLWIIWLIPGILAIILGAIAWRDDRDTLGRVGAILGAIQLILFGGSLAMYYAI